MSLETSSELDVKPRSGFPHFLCDYVMLSFIPGAPIKPFLLLTIVELAFELKICQHMF